MVIAIKNEMMIGKADIDNNPNPNRNPILKIPNYCFRDMLVGCLAFLFRIVVNAGQVGMIEHTWELSLEFAG